MEVSVIQKGIATNGDDKLAIDDIFEDEDF